MVIPKVLLSGRCAYLRFFQGDAKSLALVPSSDMPKKLHSDTCWIEIKGKDNNNVHEVTGLWQGV